MAQSGKDTNYGLQMVMPSDDNAEKNILGTIINHDEVFSEIEDILTANAFRNPLNKAVFRILKYIIQNKQVIDDSSIVAVAEKFRDKIGVSVDEVRYGIMEISLCDSMRTFQQDVERILDYSVRRNAWEMLEKMAVKVVTLTENTDDIIAEAAMSLEKIRDAASLDDGVIDAKKALKMTYDQINDNLSGVNKACVKSGFLFSDTKGGFRINNLIVIGAWTSVGKSTLALNMAVNMAVSGVPVAYYSLEMGVVELWSRIISSSTNISAGKILNYPLRRDEVSAIDKSINNYMDMPLYIDDKATISFKKMIRSVRTLVKKYRIRVFFVDYLQIFAQNQRGSNEESAIGGMVRELKNVCRELDIICVALSQLRRDKDERHPTIDMLRGSGQIEESADIVALIDRPDAHPEWGVSTFQGGKDAKGFAEIRICKGRSIGLGKYYVGFDAQRASFYEPDGYVIGDEIGYDGEVSENVPISRSVQSEDNNMPF